MLICRAFGVFAPKVNRGVLKMGVPESKQGMCPHPIRGSSTAVVRSDYADHSPPPFAPKAALRDSSCSDVVQGILLVRIESPSEDWKGRKRWTLRL